ncbi:MAG TPA: lipopolysaccharide biosynthesis protein [Azospirillaceae bacterium]|nr:lipopolysaccharide biosynthesis protein [Azospirillaceae bacterium]
MESDKEPVRPASAAGGNGTGGNGTGGKGTGGRGQAARSLGWVVLESGGVSLLSLVTVLVLARLIGPEEFGVAGLALSIVQILYVVAETLFHDAVVQRRDLRGEHIDSAIWCSILVGAVLAAACWFGAPYAEQLFHAPGLAPLLAWMGLSLVFGGATGVMTALLRRDLNFKRVAARSLAGRLLGAAAGLVLALQGFGVWALVAQQLAISFACAAALWISPPYRPRLRIVPKALGELLRFALPAFTAAFLWQTNLRLFILLTGWLLGPAAVGYLSVALKVVDTARQLVSSALQQLSLPLFSRCQDDREALRRGFKAATELTALTTLPLFAGLFVLAEEVVPFVLGAKWMPAVPLIQVLCVISMAQLVRQFGNATLTAVGAPNTLAWQNAIGLVASISLLLAFGDIGVFAATLVWGARFVFVLPWNVWMVKRIAGIGLRDQLGPPFVPILSATIMAVALAGLREAVTPELSPLPALLLLAPAGGLIYLVLVLVFDRPLVGRMAAFAMAAAGRRRGKADMPAPPPAGGATLSP